MLFVWFSTNSTIEPAFGYHLFSLPASTRAFVLQCALSCPSPLHAGGNTSSTLALTSDSAPPRPLQAGGAFGALVYCIPETDGTYQISAEDKVVDVRLGLYLHRRVHVLQKFLVGHEPLIIRRETGRERQTRRQGRSCVCFKLKSNGGLDCRM